MPIVPKKPAEPTPDTLKIDGDWQAAVKNAIQQEEGGAGVAEINEHRLEYHRPQRSSALAITTLIYGVFSGVAAIGASNLVLIAIGELASDETRLETALVISAIVVLSPILLGLLVIYRNEPSRRDRLLAILGMIAAGLWAVAITVVTLS